jgi:hypothetical protein
MKSRKMAVYSLANLNLRSFIKLDDLDGCEKIIASVVAKEAELPAFDQYPNADRVSRFTPQTAESIDPLLLSLPLTAADRMALLPGASSVRACGLERSRGSTQGRYRALPQGCTKPRVRNPPSPCQINTCFDSAPDFSSAL